MRENGYWRIEALGTGVHGWDREAFALIQVTNVTLAQVQAWQGSYISEDGAVWFKNRYRLGVWANVPWVKTMVTVGDPPVIVEEWYYIRANLHASVTPTDKVT